MRPINKNENKNRLLQNLILLLVFFNIWFPKAGIKISGVPFTISNVLFFIVFIIWIFFKIRYKNIRTSKVIIPIFLSIIYFILKYILIYSFTGKFISYITFIIPLIAYPIVFIILIDQINTLDDVDDIIKIIYFGFFAICFYSLIQFFFGIEKTAIPGLTVNLTDYQTMGSTWFMQKSNGTDIANSKIVSTYQNGNLFGINLILIYPLLFSILKKKNKSKQLALSLFLFIICGFLTLSRTAWLGIILFLFFGIILESEKTKKSLVKKIIIIFLCLLSIFIVFTYMPSVSDRFFNTNTSDWISMSGRTEGLFNVFKSVNESNSIIAYILGPAGIITYYGLAYEMLPLSLFVQTGLIGFILFYLIFYYILSKLDNSDSISEGVKLGIIIWLIIGIIECGYWLPPTAMNVFILLSIAFISSKLKKENENI